MRVLYITEKDMFLWEDGNKTTIQSAYLKNYRENLRNIEDRKAWKQKSMTVAMGYDQPVPGVVPVRQVEQFRFTGLTPCGKNKTLIYAIQIDQMGGMFKVDAYQSGNMEGHIFHDKGTFINNPSYNRKNGTLLYSVLRVGGEEDIQSLNIKSSESHTLTEGDSVDSYPRWVEGSADTFVFQSAGIGRNPSGFMVGLAPSAINRMNIVSGTIDELVSYEKYDCLAPQMDKDGYLYYIKRPYREEMGHRSNLLMDILLFPLRIINAIFNWLNFFTMMYSGKPLTSGNNPARQDGNPKKFIIHGNLVDASKIKEEPSHTTGNWLGIVPRSWQLIKRSADGHEKKLADGVIAFDRTTDGKLICCNGKNIYSIDETGTKTILIKEKFIEKVYVWEK